MKAEYLAGVDLAPVLAALMLVAGFLVADHYYPWTSFYNEFLAAGALALLAGYLFWDGGNAKAATPVLAIVIGAVSVIPAAQVLAGTIFFAGDGWLAMLYLWGLAIAVVCGHAAARRNRAATVKSMCWTLLMGAFLSAAIALYQWLQLDGMGIWVASLKPGGRPYGNISQPNMLATLLAVGVGCLFYFREKRVIGRTAFALGCAFLLFSVALTQSRTPFLIFTFLVLWAWLKRQTFSGFRPERDASICFLIFGVLFYLVPWFSQELMLSDPKIRSFNDHNLSARTAMWAQFIRAVIDGPLFGYGYNQAGVAQVSAALESGPAPMTEHSHNIFIELLVWNGWLIGTAISAFVMVWVVRRLWLAASMESWIALFAICAIGIHALLEFPLQYLYFLLPVGVFAGVVEQDCRTRVFALPKVLVWSVLLIGMGGLVWVWRDYQLLEADARKIRFEYLRIGDNRVVPGAYPDVHLLSQQREYLRYMRTSARPDMSDAELEWMRQVAYRYAFPPAMFRYAVALIMNDELQAANDQILRIGKLHPQERFDEAIEGLYALSATYPAVKQMPVLLADGAPVMPDSLSQGPHD